MLKSGNRPLSNLPPTIIPWWVESKSNQHPIQNIIKSTHKNIKYSFVSRYKEASKCMVKSTRNIS